LWLRLSAGQAACDLDPRRYELVNDAESISVAVDEDDEVVIWAGLGLVTCRPERSGAHQTIVKDSPLLGRDSGTPAQASMFVAVSSADYRMVLLQPLARGEPASPPRVTCPRMDGSPGSVYIPRIGKRSTKGR
jgi:hypothetical protein